MLPHRKNESTGSPVSLLVLHSVLKKESAKKNPLLPDAYNQRDVLGLRELTQWTRTEEKIHFESNRILQPGFLQRDPQRVVADARVAGEQWLTDCCCPSVDAALMVHIGKELVVHYKVRETELNTVAHQVYGAIAQEKKAELALLSAQVERQLQELQAPGGSLHGASLQKRVQALLEKNKKTNPLREEVEAAARLVLDIERKKITDALVAPLLKKYLAGAARSLGLILKPVYRIGTSRDYSFLGAAGSGKSTIAKQYLTEAQKTDYVIVATDNYRAFTMPGRASEDHEAKSTKNVFTRTQDFAYLVKTLVEEEVNENIKERNARPNVICDCINLSPDMRRWLSQGRVTSIVAAYAGESGYVGIAERADKRAKDADAGPADKGRYMQTTAVFQGHAEASQKLLTSIPAHIKTLVYDTHVEYGAPPRKIAEIESKSQVVVIENLKAMAEFLNKRNINIAAVNQVDLIYNINSPLNLLATHPENKAKAILDLVPATKYKAPYTVQIKDAIGRAYVELVPAEGSGVALRILDRQAFLKKTEGNGVEATVLRALFRQAMTGSLENSFELAYTKGDYNSFETALDLFLKKSTSPSPNPTPLNGVS